MAMARANILEDMKNMNDEDFAERLLAINPYLKKDQAYFYAKHRVEGCFYTIGQYKDFASCSYETARTSMDLLADYGFYRKELFKNKYIYTPVTNSYGDAKEVIELK